MLRLFDSGINKLTHHQYVYILLFMDLHSPQLDLEHCNAIAAFCAAANLRQATRAVTQFYEAILEPSGLKATQFTLLIAVAIAGSVPLTELADILVMDRTTLARNLKPLEREGWVKITRGDDLRVRFISLTEQGKQVLVKAVPLWEEAQAHMVEGLGQQRLMNLLEELSAIVKLTNTP